MRYFIIFYMYNTGSTHEPTSISVPIFGSSYQKGLLFPNKEMVQNSLGRAHKTNYIRIINVIEVNEQDYNNWLNTNEEV